MGLGAVTRRCAMTKRLPMWAKGVLLAAALSACKEPSGTDPIPGRVRWHIDGHGTTAPSADADLVFFGSREHEVIAVEKRTGRLRWRQRTAAGGPRTEGFNTVVVGDIVALADVSVYAYRRRTGEPAWVFQPSSGDRPGAFRLVTDGTLIFSGTENARAYGIDAGTGAERWMTVLGPPGGYVKAFYPSVANGRVYYGIRDFSTLFLQGRFVALDAATGAEVWSHVFEPEVPGRDAGCLGGAAFFDDLVIVAADDGRIYAFEQATGAVRWIGPSLIGRVEGFDVTGDTRRLVVADSIVVVGSDSGYLVGLRARDGTELWIATPRLGSAYGQPSTDGRIVYWAFLGGQVAAIEASTGRRLWSTGESVSSQMPLVSDSSLYVGGTTGYYALRR